MKFLISFLLVILLSFVTGLYFDWWAFAIAGFLIGLAIPLKPGYGFLAGLAGLMVLWGGLILWFNGANNGMLASKVAAILPLQGSAALLMLVTVLIGMLIGGFSVMSGNLLRRLL